MPAGEGEAYELLEQLRWGGRPASCPQCGAVGSSSYLRPADGISRHTRTGHRSQRRVWRCATCRRQFTVLTATILQGTRIDLRTWIGALARCAEAPALTPAQLAAEFGVTAETARLVLGRVAAACAVAGIAGTAGVAGAAGVRGSGGVARVDSVAAPGQLSPAAQQSIRAVLALPVAVAADVRARVPARRRPTRQHGPSADFGDDAEDPDDRIDGRNG